MTDYILIWYADIQILVEVLIKMASGFIPGILIATVIYIPFRKQIHKMLEIMLTDSRF